MRLIFLLTCLLTTGIVFAQKNTNPIEQARALLTENKDTAALNILDRLLVADTMNYDASWLRATIFYNQGKLIKAHKDVSRVIRLRPDSASAYFLRANIYYHLQNTEAALVDVNMAFDRLNDERAIIKCFVLRASCFTRKRDFQSSYEDLSRAYVLDTNNTDVLNDMALVLDELGRRQEGIKCLHKIVVLDSTYYSAFANLGFQYSKDGRFKEAIEFFDKSIALNSYNPYSFNNRGYAKLGLKDYEGALTDINKSIELMETNSYAYRNRALVYLAQNDKEKACKDIKRALKYNFTKLYGDEVLGLESLYCTK